MRRLTWVLILLVFGSPMIHAQSHKKPEKAASPAVVSTTTAPYWC